MATSNGPGSEGIGPESPESMDAMQTAGGRAGATAGAGRPKPPFYRTLWGQVLIGVALAIVGGYFQPHTAVARKPLGDAFIRLITMIITLVIFCTVVTGIAGMEDMKKVGRVGGKALLYFEIVSTLALLVGVGVGNLVHTGAAF